MTAPSAPETTPDWLSGAVLYQIYPQSFADSDGDGIGDFPGVLRHLDYLAWLGVDVVWFSPCFTSPFADAGYDVSDYFTVAPRYGTNDDLRRVVDAARDRGIRVMLDLVPGHTSHRHEWFRRSAADPDDHRYIWSDRVGSPVSRWIPAPGARDGYYLANFYPVQPALNFGYARMDPAEPWRQPVDAPGPRANRAALREIMAYWFDQGVAGFRVDMAFSLVKDDPGMVETGRLWTGIRQWIDREYPDRALIAEWGDPGVSVPAGFHADFFLHFVGDALRSLWGNSQGSHSFRWNTDPCFFAPEGEGSMRPFLDAWERATGAIGGVGHVALPTANHDFSRLAVGTRTREMTAPVFAFLMTWPTLPTIYFGDEIGMRYVPDTPDVEGADLDDGQRRQGSRTPMQWDGTAGAGFSTADQDRFYLPLDPAPDRPDVADSLADPGSLLNQVQRLIALRRARPALGSTGSVEVLNETYPLVYRRGDDHLIIINPRRAPARFTLKGADALRPLEVRGVTVDGDEMTADGFSYGVFTR
ncbi:trehalose synthase [Streptomyces sp. DvalAA-14]|uniref:alpha-amylase family glycosyl hydrolase n=1 Tax=unclassified Streptomyces TaxID=2593676 RepID=UPI00081BB069|nr:MULTISPECIES: alpha-amylase family glycosyl hydrolase [unclassified Streptomyces]MYS22987.1 oligo-1,6-glucosidase [Streptomyces sp. SID4948]SCE25466.1 trehalose synthase [Streptomyces sp. DvalAA-14]